MISDADDRIKPHLLVGERLLWTGRPRDTRALLRRAPVIILVAIAALVFRAMPLDYSLAGQAQVNSILLAVIVFALIAEAVVFHSYLATTFYGVTNLRVIIVSGLRSPEATSVFLDRIKASQLRLTRHGRNLELRRHSPNLRYSPYYPFTNPSLPPAMLGAEHYRLFGLIDAGHVYQLILDSCEHLA